MEAERTPEREHDLPGLELVGVTECQGWQVPFVDLDDRQIRLEVDPNDLTAHRAAASRQNRLADGWQRHLDAQSLRAADDVRVGDDVAVAIDDDARPGCALSGDEIGGAGDESFTGCE